MLTQSQVKHIAALKLKKFREEHGQFIAEGHKLVMDMVSSEFLITGIYASGEWIAENHSMVSAKKIPVFETTDREMERISALSTPSQVMAVVNIPVPDHTVSGIHDFSNSLSLALDDIRDPGNLGTIIRIADWFGIETVLCSQNCVDVYNPKVVQATMGSIARVKVLSCNLVEVLGGTLSGSPTPSGSPTLSGSPTPSGSPTLSGCRDEVPVYGTFLEGDSLYDQTLSNQGVIVIGNEARGISPELAPFITNKIFIPSFGSSVNGKAESLNASVATAIICAEFRRVKPNPNA
jgi:TrmH family RNA methyltransferase